MNGIQVILLTGIVFIGLYFIVRWRNRLIDILLLTGMIFCAAVLIVWPDTTNLIAKKLGVGRGADLIFYISILIFWFVVLKLYARIKSLEREFTAFIRENALKNAKEPSDDEINIGRNE